MAELSVRLQTAWRKLPEGFRGSGPVVRLRTTVQRTLQGPEEAPAELEGAAPEQKVVRTIEELDEMLRLLDEAGAVSDDAFRSAFATFRMELDTEMPDDPHGDEYREAVFKAYELIRGEPYSLKNESTSFDIDAAVADPFPYATRSPATVGGQLIAVGHIIQTMNLPPGSRVLEFGPGWGNTTLALAQMGYDVTVVDVEPSFLEVIRRRTELAGRSVKLLEGDFALASTMHDEYDAVLFFASFHHCSDHVAFLEQLNRLIAPEGIILFVGENISDDFPYPWGLRMDGESLWAIRRQGWLELGFQEEYFRDTMARFGWSLEKRPCPSSAWGEAFLAKRTR